MRTVFVRICAAVAFLSAGVRCVAADIDPSLGEVVPNELLNRWIGDKFGEQVLQAVQAAHERRERALSNASVSIRKNAQPRSDVSINKDLDPKGKLRPNTVNAHWYRDGERFFFQQKMAVDGMSPTRTMKWFDGSSRWALASQKTAKGERLTGEKFVDHAWQPTDGVTDDIVFGLRFGPALPTLTHLFQSGNAKFAGFEAVNGSLCCRVDFGTHDHPPYPGISSRMGSSSLSAWFDVAHGFCPHLIQRRFGPTNWKNDLPPVPVGSEAMSIVATEFSNVHSAAIGGDVWIVKRASEANRAFLVEWVVEEADLSTRVSSSVFYPPLPSGTVVTSITGTQDRQLMLKDRGGEALDSVLQQYEHGLAASLKKSNCDPSELRSLHQAAVVCIRLASYFGLGLILSAPLAFVYLRRGSTIVKSEMQEDQHA